jgi:TPR repeat protein
MKLPLDLHTCAEVACNQLARFITTYLPAGRLDPCHSLVTVSELRCLSIVVLRPTHNGMSPGLVNIAMTERYATLRTHTPDVVSGPSTTSWDQRRSVVPTDYNELSPLDLIAEQGRILNKRLTQHGRKTSEDNIPVIGGLDSSVFPKFGTGDMYEDRVFRYDRRDRLPDRRKAGEQEKNPMELLSLSTMSLLSPRPTSSRSPSQSSSVLSIDTSSDGSSTPTEDYLPPQTYQTQSNAPRLRPIIKTQHLNQAPSPHSPTTPDQLSDRAYSPRPFSPETAKTLDRPRIPSPLLARPIRTPSINFSRPYSSRSSTFSDTSSAYEVTSSVAVDYFTGPEPSPPLYGRSPASVMSSPGLEDEDMQNLPRGRRKSRPVDTGVFFHSKSIKSATSAHRWPTTPVTPTNQRKFFPDNLSAGRRTPSNERSLGRSIDRPSFDRASFDRLPPDRPTHRPTTSSSEHSPYAGHDHHVRRPSTAPRPRSQDPNPRLYPPEPTDVFSSPTQVLSSTPTLSNIAIPPDSTISADDHVSLAIKYHQQDLLPQSTHHFQLAAEMGSPTGMLLYSLSLRHGWGCAANPAKAVEYLHLAAENASAQADQNGVVRPAATPTPVTPISPDLKNPTNGKGSATLALAIYELGQSYMHGWGVQKDKHLALRCFEMSANFGDTDGQWYRA